MKAIIRPKCLTPGIFSYNPTHPLPSFYPSTLHRNSVLIQVSSAAINPVDYKLPKLILGSVVGFDFCGCILKCGSSVSNFEVGQIVYGMARNGSLAEQTIASTDHIAIQPEGWKKSECAVLGVAYLSAWQALRRGNITMTSLERKSVCILGASGGCGLAGVQLCKAMAVSRIVGVCSSRNEQMVRNAGATEVVDYTNSSQLQAFFQKNKGCFDCVYDAATGSGAGEDYWTQSIPLLKNANTMAEYCGKYVSLNGPPTKWMKEFVGMHKKKNESIVLMQPNTDDLEQIVEMMDKIKMRPMLNVMPFTEDGMTEAFRMIKGRRTRGKIVFQIN